jgi:formylglycine-generating enzyme required for sulfatase activity
MKSTFKRIGIIVFAAVIGFSFVSCNFGDLFGGKEEEQEPQTTNTQTPGGQTPGGEQPGGQTPGGEQPGGQTPGGGEQPGGGQTPSNPTVNWPQGLTAVYGQTLSAISLASFTNSGGTAGAFSWTTPSGSVGSFGSYGAQSHNMTFTPSDTANYNTVTNSVPVFVSLAEMVRVAGGTFTMGSSNSQDYSANPPHLVTLSSDFYIGKYEVTQKQYETVMMSLPSGGLYIDPDWRGDNHPVYYVRWYDALVFCNWLSEMEGLTPAYRISGSTDPAVWGTVPNSSDTIWDAATIVNGSTGYRLPTEAQWEYAARGGQSANDYKIYSGSDTVGDVAWYSGNSGSKTHEVGTKAANELGLYDMSGNVYEWCWDWYGTYPTAAGTDPVGASSGSARVYRGGSWKSAAVQYARSASRNSHVPYARFDDLGFRLLRPAQ